MNEQPTYIPTVHWFAVFTAIATLGLIGVGGVVTSKGVGMAVPDWPNTYGYNMFFFPFSQWVGGILWEHSHRLVASGVGFLTLLLTIWLFGVRGRGFLRYGLSPLFLLVAFWAFSRPEPRVQDGTLMVGLCGLALGASFVWPRCQPSRPLLRWMGVVALIAVIGQGVLGGLRVTLYADQLGIFHAATAQLFLVLICSLALLSSKWWVRAKLKAADAVGTRTIAWGMGALTMLVFCQLVLGATMRHQHAGLAVEQFPLIAQGKLIPETDDAALARLNSERMDYRDFNPVTATHIWVHMAHRWGAGLILLSGFVLVILGLRGLKRGQWLGNGLIVWLSILCLQGVLGAATIWSNKAADIATLHVLFGAVTLALGAVLTMIAARFSYLAQTRPAPSGVGQVDLELAAASASASPTAPQGSF